MAADDDQVRARLRALEAEVAATAEADRQRKAEARERILARRAAASAESDDLRRRQAALVGRRGRDERGPEPEAPSVGAQARDLERAMVLARKAGDVKAELTRPTKAGEKSWLISSALSFFFGPLGWLYAGSLRETIPAAVLYVMVAGIVSKILPAFLLMPVLMVLLPLSGIAGLVYAIGHNRAGKRIKLFGDDDAKAPRLGGLLGRGKSSDDR